MSSQLVHGVDTPASAKVLGLNTPVKIGLRVQLTEKGRAGFDEQLNELAGPDGRGRITTLMNDGLICAVRWDKNPHEEHFYRTGDGSVIDVQNHCRVITAKNLISKEISIPSLFYFHVHRRKAGS